MLRTNTDVHQIARPGRCADVEIVSGHSAAACRPGEGRRCAGQRAARRRAGDDASRLRVFGVGVVVFNDGRAEVRLQLHVDRGSIGGQSHRRAGARTNTDVHQIARPERCADVEIVSGHSAAACRPGEGRRCAGQRAARRRAGDDGCRRPAATAGQIASREGEDADRRAAEDRIGDSRLSGRIGVAGIGVSDYQHTVEIDTGAWCPAIPTAACRGAAARFAFADASKSEVQ